MGDRLEGGCACGEIRYRLLSDPLFVHCCHCLNCQRQTGSAFVINILIETDRIELLTGEPQPIDVPRSSGTQRIFRCPTCQIAVYSRYTPRDDPLRPRGDAGRSVRGRAGRPHLHAVEAALGHAARGRPGVQHVLRHREAVAGREPRAARRARRRATARSRSLGGSRRVSAHVARELADDGRGLGAAASRAREVRSSRHGLDAPCAGSAARRHPARARRRPRRYGLRGRRRAGRDGRLISTDFSSEMVEVARRRARELGVRNVEHLVADAEEIPLDDDSVDGAVCRFGLMLMADPAARPRRDPPRRASRRTPGPRSAGAPRSAIPGSPSRAGHSPNSGWPRPLSPERRACSCSPITTG